MNNAGLMNALLALASRHLHLNPTLDAEEICSKKELALQYYYQTLHYVQKAMQYSSYKTSLELLATTLIISAYEMLDNSTNDWERHLEGVFLIQRSQTLHGESGGLHAAVWWAWLCQVCLNSRGERVGHTNTSAGHMGGFPGKEEDTNVLRPTKASLITFTTRAGYEIDLYHCESDKLLRRASGGRELPQPYRRCDGSSYHAG